MGVNAEVMAILTDTQARLQVLRVTCLNWKPEQPTDERTKKRPRPWMPRPLARSGCSLASRMRGLSFNWGRSAKN